MTGFLSTWYIEMLFILFKYLKYCLISFQTDFGKAFWEQNVEQTSR